jgi:sterol desaturase/sphingolipid hydroxylase (fatty acid hydroxylase superfamily)
LLTCTGVKTGNELKVPLLPAISFAVGPRLAEIQHLLGYLARPFTVSHVVGYGVMFALVVLVTVWQGHNPRRYLRKSFRTDLAYSAWFPVYTVLIGIPLSLQLARIVTDYVPFLRIGLLSGLPGWLNIVLWLVVSDLSLYWLHRSMHHSRWLWAIHKVHHSQRELNPLTTWRVHWLEFVYLNLGAFATGLFLGDFAGLHPIAVGILAASQFAQHSGLAWTYGPLGRLFVSPRFHARHHSVAPEDLNVNFGSLFIIWDRVFGTARDVPDEMPGHGLSEAEDNVPASFLGQLFYPVSLLLQRRVSDQDVA